VLGLLLPAEAMRRRLADLNPKASVKLANRLLEAQDRDYWRPEASMLEALRAAGEELEDRLEGLSKDPQIFSKSPAGTGPFLFLDWKHGQALSLRKFNPYWRESGRAHMTRLIFRVIPDNETRLRSFETGALDLLD